VAPSRELVLAIHCCRAAFARGEASVVLSDAQLDWSLFLRLVRFHRVQGLAWSALTEQRDQVPRDIAEALADDAAAIAAQICGTPWNAATCSRISNGPRSRFSS